MGIAGLPAFRYAYKSRGRSATAASSPPDFKLRHTITARHSLARISLSAMLGPMISTLELAMAKAAELPEAAQEQIGLEPLDRIAALEELRAEIQIGRRELDAGLGRAVNAEDVIRRGHERFARR